ncbi:hypothetical protein PAL_GLEAN10004965 [Pteropus alecto]|uniref:Uncharacterized protein n=1 Tax=Pteropus alecto TaxID=9402 RepID=L5KKE1_PTEAL|nr:hypothetical protein PAL_GLEAN10004965 [Pteropus alecto]
MTDASSLFRARPRRVFSEGAKVRGPRTGREEALCRALTWQLDEEADFPSSSPTPDTGKRSPDLSDYWRTRAPERGKGQHLRKQKRTLQLRRTVGALLPSAPSPRAWQRRQRPWTLTHQLSMTQSQVDGKTAVPADGDTAANSYRNTEARQKTPGNRFSNVLQES